MPLRRPSKSDLAAISSKRHLRLTEVELDDLYELVCENLNLYDELEQYPDPVREVVPAVRVPGRRLTPAEDPLNAVVRTCSVKLPGARGKLTGKSVGVKDTICVAGIPMSCASRLLYDYTPDIDATIVTRSRYGVCTSRQDDISIPDCSGKYSHRHAVVKAKDRAVIHLRGISRAQ